MIHSGLNSAQFVVAFCDHNGSSGQTSTNGELNSFVSSIKSSGSKGSAWTPLHTFAAQTICKAFEVQRLVMDIGDGSGVGSRATLASLVAALLCPAHPFVPSTTGIGFVNGGVGIDSAMGADTAALGFKGANSTRVFAAPTVLSHSDCGSGPFAIGSGMGDEERRHQKVLTANPISSKAMMRPVRFIPFRTLPVTQSSPPLTNSTATPRATSRSAWTETCNVFVGNRPMVGRVALRHDEASQREAAYLRVEFSSASLRLCGKISA